jgi:undecaprenyl-diphosphatase
MLGGVWMIWLDRWKLRGHRRVEAARSEGRGSSEAAGAGAGVTLETMGWKRALAIGGLQCVAMWPGTSRSMMTIGGGVLVGLKPKEAAEFSFLLGLPTLGGACVLKLFKNLKESRETGVPNLFEVIGWVPSVVGLVVAAASAVVAVRWLVGFLNRHGLEAFGWYRIGLSVVLGALIVGGVVRL